MFRALGSLILLTAALACADTNQLAPSAPDAPRDAAGSSSRRVAVVSRNLYVGADVDAVIAALASPDQADDLPALTTAIETLQKTDFPSRARAIAGEIAGARPHAVGLQEVSQIDIDLSPLQIPISLNLDFLPILQQALADRGLHYVVGASVKNIEAAPLPGVSLVDFDVILVDADRVHMTGSGSHTYATNIGEVAPGVVLKRGWVTVNGTVDGRDYVFASTHLESGIAPGLDLLRAAQATELAAALASETPTLLMGDLNDQPGSPMYQVLAGAGFTDVWTALRPGTSGYTCCHAADLSDRVARFTQRIDYILARGVGFSAGTTLGSITRLGAEPSDRLDGPVSSIWPSDHAGLAAELLLPAAP